VIDQFEQRLADLLAERITSSTFERIVRAEVDAAPTAGKAEAVVRVERAAATAVVGDDTREVLPDKSSLRRVLRLSGTSLVRVQAAPGLDAATRNAQRKVLITAVDAVLLALHDADVRSGSAFETGSDLGFALEAFRLADWGPPEVPAVNSIAVEIRYQFEGRFWPVEPVVVGGAIKKMPLRLAVQSGMPDPIVIRAGSADLTIPVPLELQVSDGAEARLAARLLGASPPGSLIGDATGLPPGSVGFPRGTDGIFRVVYRPPPTVVGQAEARIALELAAKDRPTVPLGAVTVVIGS